MVELFEANFGDVMVTARTREVAENFTVWGIPPRSVTAIWVDPDDPIGSLKLALAVG